MYARKINNAKRHQELLDIVTAKGGKVLDGYYDRTVTIYTIQCASGHIWHPQWVHIVNRGSYCAECNLSTRGNRPTLTMKQLEAIGVSRGYTCTDKSSEGGVIEMSWKCVEGHTFDISAKKPKNMPRCKRCEKPKTIVKNYSIENMHVLASNRGGLCLSKEYVTCTTKLLWKCGVCKHEWYAEPRAVAQGKWCRRCAVEANKLVTKCTIEEVRAKGLKEGFILLSVEYIRSNLPLDWKCNKEHKFSMRYSDTYTVKGCPVCSSSKEERKIYNNLEESNVEFIREWKLPKTQMRYDFYLPKYNLIIEYDGIYHFQPIHGEDTLKTRLEHDEYKDKYCEDNEISLFRISHFDTDYTIEEWVRIAINLVQEADYYHISPHREYKNRLLAGL
jgi:very-short-patch-repair endonuclease